MKYGPLTFFVNIFDEIYKAWKEKQHAGKSEKCPVRKSDLIQITSNIKMSHSYAYFATIWRFTDYIFVELKAFTLVSFILDHTVAPSA